MSGAQKNPRRSYTLTGIYADKSKLKYGACSFPSTMLIFQTGSKQAENGTFFLSKAVEKRLKMAFLIFSKAVMKR